MKSLVFLGLLIVGVVCEKKLIFVQSIWRHGDRSPTKTFKSDFFQEDSWKFGGGGWGQLSPKGMAQHLNLGKKIRKRYVNETTFLSQYYNSKEIFVRSTDVNRTLISAYSNLMGMYGLPEYNNRAGVDYTNETGWPMGFVPIPIHTVDNDKDHIGNVDGSCNIQDQIWDVARSSDEVQSFIKNNSDLFATLSKNCGQVVDIDNLWIIANSLMIERIYYENELLKNNKWYTEEFYKQIDTANDQVQLYNNGIFAKRNVVKGYDVGLLLRKVRGGPALNDIVNHMNHKISCLNNSTGGCEWINHLKYYAYSMHDTTIYAIFSALLMEEKVIAPKGQYPQYSACVLFELYQEGDNFFFKIFYHSDDSQDFVDITSDLDGCAKGQFCPLEVIQRFANETKPDQPIDQWCNVPFPYQSATRSSIIGVFSFLIAYLLF